MQSEEKQANYKIKMAEKSDLANTEQVDIPLESHDDETSKLNDPSVPPEYQSPKIDFNEGWKDRGFAIIFFLYLIAVMITSLVLGIPAIQSYAEHMKHHGKPTLFDINMTLLLHLFGGIIATASVMSFIMFFFLQLCAGRMIIFSLVFIILTQLGLCVFLVLIGLWPAAIVPLIVLLITVVFICMIKKRIKFADANIRIACAVLRQHPSLLFIAIFVLVLQILWFVICCLLILGVLHAADRSVFDNFMNQLTKNSTRHAESTKYPWVVQTTSTTTTIKRPYQYGINNVVQEDDNKNWHSKIVGYMIFFLVLFIWYWATMTFANISHFISACAVGHWWFPTDTNGQYQISHGVKRAFTTNLGTISFGSLLEAFVRDLRMCIGKNERGCITLCVQCILSIIEKIIGYINEWAFVYSALTGQSFIQAGKSFFKLLKQRGWTMIINDSLVGNCLGLVNFIVGITTAIITCVFYYFFFSTVSQKLVPTIVIAAFSSFFLGIILSLTVTTILKSCVRAAFVCFVLNPAALGATHPDHLQRLTEVWHEFYPNEFATSGYANLYPKAPSTNYV